MIFNQSATQRFDQHTTSPDTIIINEGAVVNIIFEHTSTPNLTIELQGAGAECHVYYIHQFTTNTHQCNIHFIHHAANTTSAVIAHIIADGDGVGILHATTTIHPQCDNAATKQDLKALVLSPTAKVDGKPVLFIHHNLVKASHGCAIGGIDENQLFYIISRGLDRQSARQLLCDGFLCELRESIGKL